VAPSSIHLTCTMRHVSKRTADSKLAALDWIIAACTIKQPSAFSRFLVDVASKRFTSILAKEGFMALLISSCLPQPRSIRKWKTQAKRTRSQQSVLHLHASSSLFRSLPITSQAIHAVSQWKLWHSNTLSNSRRQQLHTQHQKFLHH
jgi:hypothetical protein